LAGEAVLLRVVCTRLLGDESLPVDGELEEPFAARAWPALQSAVRGLAAGDSSALEAMVERLAGLGPGLTPSGDDVIGGMLFAVAFVRRRAVGSELGRACDPSALSPDLSP